MFGVAKKRKHSAVLSKQQSTYRIDQWQVFIFFIFHLYLLAQGVDEGRKGEIGYNLYLTLTQNLFFFLFDFLTSVILRQNPIKVCVFSA